MAAGLQGILSGAETDKCTGIQVTGNLAPIPEGRLKSHLLGKNYL